MTGQPALFLERFEEFEDPLQRSARCYRWKWIVFGRVFWAEWSKAFSRELKYDCGIIDSSAYVELHKSVFVRQDGKANECHWYQHFPMIVTALARLRPSFSG